MTRQPEIRQEIMDAAFEWLARMEDGDLSASDRLAFSAWLGAAAEHREAYGRARLFWRTLGGVDREALSEAFCGPSWRERVVSVLRPAGLGLGLRRLSPALGVAALALLVLALVRPLLAPTDRDAGAFECSTGIGQTRLVSLEDGSSITVGPATTVRVRFSAGARRVEMSAGEAFFQVARDAARPFTVETGDLRVVVHGTAFDVRSSGMASEVAVAEGVVSVRHPVLGPGRTTAAGAEVPGAADGGTRLLVAGQRFSSSARAASSAVTATPLESVGAWRRQLLVYIDTPLAEIVADMNRYQSRPIRLHDAAVGGIRVTATFSSADIDGMLAALPVVFPVRLETTADGLTLCPAR